LILVRSPRSCSHVLTHPSCSVCKNSVIAVYHVPNVSKEQLLHHWMSGHSVEPFYSIYRTVEVLETVDTRTSPELQDYCKYVGSIKTTGMEGFVKQNQEER
jgi:hypothetical protein